MEWVFLQIFNNLIEYPITVELDKVKKMFTQIRNTLTLVTYLVGELFKERMVALDIVPEEYKIEVVYFQDSGVGIESSVAFYFSTDKMSHRMSVRMNGTGNVFVDASSSLFEFSYSEDVIEDVVLFQLSSEMEQLLPEDLSGQIDELLVEIFEAFAYNDTQADNMSGNISGKNMLE